MIALNDKEMACIVGGIVPGSRVGVHNTDITPAMDAIGRGIYEALVALGAAYLFSR